MTGFFVAQHCPGHSNFSVQIRAVHALGSSGQTRIEQHKTLQAAGFSLRASRFALGVLTNALIDASTECGLDPSRDD